MQKETIAITSDHAGFWLKEKLFQYLVRDGYMVLDLGTDSEESIDYPEFGHSLAKTILNKKASYGISLCGSGNGINMVANKYNGIRSALCWSTEISRLARAHNNANICALPGRFLNYETAVIIVKTFLETSFDGGRHERRILKIPTNR
jgi:ribose 5-phosphate isomerase B